MTRLTFLGAAETVTGSRTHGDPAAADAFRRRQGETFGWKVSVPREDEAADLI